MKSISFFLIIICIASILGFQSCKESTANPVNEDTKIVCTPNISFPEDHGQGQKHTLVFIDLTDTTIYGPSAFKYLKQILEKRLSTAEDRRPEFDYKADRIQLFFISANTATTQTTSLAKVDLRIPPLGKLIPGQDIINNSIKRRYLCGIEELIADKMQEIDEEIQRIRLANEDVNSDVLGLFHIANREFIRSDATDKAIFVISDMEHFCNNGGYFSCKETKICSSGCKRVYAQGSAANDALLIEKKLGGLTALDQVGFHYMRGDRPVGNTNQDVLNFIQDYWASLILEIGMKEFDKID